jgi:ABC-type transport system involved in cytochrome c biogenesis permease subunit
MLWRPLVYAGVIVQSGYLIYRGITLGRLPLIGVYDTMNFLAASIVIFALAVDHVHRQRQGYITSLSALAAFFTVMTLFQKPYAMPLPPVLNTYWFEFHVALSFFSYALFGVAAVLGVMYLKYGEQALESLQYKAVFMGYSMFSLSMIFGGVWAYLAWGTYWLWTPKELWTSLLWIYYGAYLHIRLMPKFAGRPVAWVGVIGFAVVLFTYLGVGLLMKSSHSF